MDQKLKLEDRPASRRLKLTEEVVAKIAPGERVYDTGVPGFFALGLKEGVSFRVLADIPAAARRWGMPKRTVERAVGRWSPNKRTGNLTPKAARTIADNFVAAIKKGEDPSPRIVTPVAGWTVEQAWLAYRNGYLVKEGASNKTIRTYEFAYKLHVDLDPHVGEEQDEAQARIIAKLVKLKQPPTWIIVSGGGVQVIWDLVEPVPIGGNPEVYEDLKMYNVQLERELGGDHCHNIDRIMRIPGTINCPDERKIKKGRKRALAYVVKHTATNYTIADFVKAAALSQSLDWFHGAGHKR